MAYELRRNSKGKLVRDLRKSPFTKADVDQIDRILVSEKKILKRYQAMKMSDPYLVDHSKRIISRLNTQKRSVKKALKKKK